MKALLSLYDKEHSDIFAHGLMDNDIDVYSTRGTYSYLKDRGVLTRPTSEITGFEQLLEGRIKTLHPNIHHMIATGEFGVLAVNLMPLGVKGDEPLDSMDIGGVSLIRSGVKNWRNVCVITDPADYGPVMSEIRHGGIKNETRYLSALKAIKTVMAYDWNVFETLKNRSI
ncbi:MAG: hypothetical protein JW825_06930 [Candidatus Methanofastidiosa archaeon]|nr:hypothetical protein [Candidatus Methanofastidiosa archaeon]